MKTPAFVFDLQDIHDHLAALVKDDANNTEAARQTRDYYRSAGASLVWIDRSGVRDDADSLLVWLQQLHEIGFSEQAFGVELIRQDLQRMRTLSFDEGQHQASRVAARLEYRLTKACVQYCMGQRFGFVNPGKILNNLDIEKQDTLQRVVKYRGLFDVKMDTPYRHYAFDVIGKIRKDSLPAYLWEIQPRDALYGKLKRMLATASTADMRRRIIVNMERCRWRRHQPFADTGKHIVVNIPAYHLYACHDSAVVLDMRVACGALKTKTPQLSSYIEWLEFNPQWVIPMSIIENDVARHAGDSAYFARNRYHIYDRAANTELPVGQVSRQMLLSGKLRVAQQGGAGNSLGRVVFRFKNNFSVFLHDTSSPAAFQRESRAVSHGCVRVAKPYDLVCFVLDEPDEWLLDRIRISMGLAPETDRGLQYVRTHDEDDRKLIGYQPVSSRVPLYIIYYTLWPDADGVLQTWPDVYGYDEVMWNHLKPYLS